MKVKLAQLAHTRSGDKGDMSNIGVIAWRPEDYPVLLREVTAERDFRRLRVRLTRARSLAADAFCSCLDCVETPARGDKQRPPVAAAETDVGRPSLRHRDLLTLPKRMLRGIVL